MDTAANAAQRAGTSREGLLTRHPLMFYFIIAYGGSWLLALPYVRFPNGAALLPFRWPVPFPVSATVIPFAGPFLAAFIMTGITEGKAGTRRLLRRIVLWRVGLGWYLFALVGVPAITVLGAILLPGVLASFRAPAFSWVLTYSVSFVVAFVIGGPLGEEPGWRGFALPRLQQLYGPLVGTLILGPIHVLWHLPYFFIPEWGTARDTILEVSCYVFSGIALTFVYTWLFNRTKGSVFLPILAHTSVDAFNSSEFFLAPIVRGASNVPFLIAFGPVAVLLVVFTRGRLGYQRYLREAGPGAAPQGTHA
ncbi:MAG: type II CAAX endopeptidase family protein [Candidatus Udaeobacter sp.]